MKQLSTTALISCSDKLCSEISNKRVAVYLMKKGLYHTVLVVIEYRYSSNVHTPVQCQIYFINRVYMTMFSMWLSKYMPVQIP